MSTTTALSTDNDKARAGWLEGRRGYVGGSDAASMFNEGYGCRLRLVYDKAGVIPDFLPSDRERKRMSRGTKLEATVAKEFEEETERLGFQLDTRRAPAHRLHPVFHFAGVNIDRQILMPEDVNRWSTLSQLWPLAFPSASSETFPGSPGTGLLECKTTNEHVLRIARDKGLAPDYILQMQHGLAVTGYRWGCFALLDVSAFDLLVFPMLRDEALITRILQETEQVRLDAKSAAKELTQLGALPVQLPEILGIPRLPQDDKRCKSCLWRRSCRGDQYVAEQQGFEASDSKVDWTVVDDDTFIALARDLRDARRALASVKETEEQVADLVKAEMVARQLHHILFPTVGLKIAFAERKGYTKWDGSALEGLTDAVAKKEADTPQGDLKAALAQILLTLRSARGTTKPSRPFVPAET